MHTYTYLCRCDQTLRSRALPTRASTQSRPRSWKASSMAPRLTPLPSVSSLPLSMSWPVIHSIRSVPRTPHPAQAPCYILNYILRYCNMQSVHGYPAWVWHTSYVYFPKLQAKAKLAGLFCHISVKRDLRALASSFASGFVKCIYIYVYVQTIQPAVTFSQAGS